jgi:hypothetical protein
MTSLQNHNMIKKTKMIFRSVTDYFTDKMTEGSIQYTVKPVLRGHLWDKEKVTL